jgi:hypothetical protein
MYAKARRKGFWGIGRSEATLGYPLIGVPGLIAGEFDVLPAKRGDVL